MTVLFGIVLTWASLTVQLNIYLDHRRAAATAAESHRSEMRPSVSQ